MDKFKYLGAVEIFLLTADKKEILLLKRAEHRKYLPNYHAGLGGKMDLDILEAPIECAYREIFEESGIEKSDIFSLELKAVISAEDRYGKWFVYEFVGFLNKDFNKPLVQTDEGELFFTRIENIKDLNLIPDLKDGFLEQIINENKLFWIKSYFDNDNNLIKKEILS